MDRFFIRAKDELEIIIHCYAQLKVRLLGGRATGFIPKEPLGGDFREILTFVLVQNTLLAPHPAPAKRTMIRDMVPAASTGCAISTGRSLIVTIDGQLLVSEMVLILGGW